LNYLFSSFFLFFYLSFTSSALNFKASPLPPLLFIFLFEQKRSRNCQNRSNPTTTQKKKKKKNPEKNKENMLLSALFFLLLTMRLSLGGTITIANDETVQLTDYNTLTYSATLSNLPSPLSPFADVRVYVRILHPYPADLRITLSSPAATIILSNYRLGSCDYSLYDSTFTQSATLSVTESVACTCCHQLDGSFSWLYYPFLRPEQSLHSFRDTNPNGQWELQILDNNFGNEGEIYGLNLQIQGKNTFQKIEPKL